MRENTIGQKCEPRAFQANGPKYFWHRGSKMEISWNKLIIFDKCKESQCGWIIVNRVESANIESWNEKQRSDITGYCRFQKGGWILL